MLPNIAERCRTLPNFARRFVQQYPAISGNILAKCGKIWQYPAISGNIRQYPVPAAPHAISGNLRQYPAISGNLRHHPAISGSMADCLISGCLCPLVACTPDWGADYHLGSMRPMHGSDLWALFMEPVHVRRFPSIRSRTSRDKTLNCFLF